MFTFDLITIISVILFILLICICVSLIKTDVFVVKRCFEIYEDTTQKNRKCKIAIHVGALILSLIALMMSAYTCILVVKHFL